MQQPADYNGGWVKGGAGVASSGMGGLLKC